MELTKEELQYLLNAVDFELRQKGLQIAGSVLVVATKLKEMLEAVEATPRVKVKAPAPAKKSGG